MKRTADINEILKPLDRCQEQAYLSSAIQVADILDWIIKQLGPFKVWQTSFSISEEFLRRLFFINKRTQGITQYKLLLDFKATKKTLSLWPFICQTIEEVYLADNHSKILLAQNKKKQAVTVITSQNLTRGNRAESAYISTNVHIFETLKSQIEDVIKNHSLTLHELYNRTN